MAQGTGDADRESADDRGRLRVPLASTVYYAEIPEEEVCRAGSLLLTAPLRTLVDCALAGLPPDSEGCVVCPECGASWRAAVGVEGGGVEGRKPAPTIG